MKKINLNLAKSYLSRDEMRTISGGKVWVRNLAGTGNTMVRGGETVCECSWDYNENDGTGWHYRTGACPSGNLEYSCI